MDQGLFGKKKNHGYKATLLGFLLLYLTSRFSCVAYASFEGPEFSIALGLPFRLPAHRKVLGWCGLDFFGEVSMGPWIG